MANFLFANRLLTYSKLHSTERNRCRNPDFHFLFCALAECSLKFITRNCNFISPIRVNLQREKRRQENFSQDQDGSLPGCLADWLAGRSKLQAEPDADGYADGDGNAFAALGAFGQPIDAQISCILFNKVCCQPKVAKMV